MQDDSKLKVGRYLRHGVVVIGLQLRQKMYGLPSQNSIYRTVKTAFSMIQ